jgi:hypothetical protein
VKRFRIFIGIKFEGRAAGEYVSQEIQAWDKAAAETYAEMLATLYLKAKFKNTGTTAQPHYRVEPLS